MGSTTIPTKDGLKRLLQLSEEISYGHDMGNFFSGTSAAMGRGVAFKRVAFKRADRDRRKGVRLSHASLYEVVWGGFQARRGLQTMNNRDSLHNRRRPAVSKLSIRVVLPS